MYSTKVALRGMSFYAYHGYYEWERRIGNTYVIDAVADLEMTGHPNEQIDSTLNYESIYQITSRHMELQYQLLETLAYNIATEIKALDAMIKSITITIRKKNPPLGGKVDHSEVTITL